jgi:hypothetical protein
VDRASRAERRLGQPRSERDAAFLKRFNARMQHGNGDNGAPADEPAGAAVTATDAAIQALATEVSALRHQVAALTERLIGTRPDATPPEPAPGEDAPG